jgi:histidyl-tRNA synthetase
LTRATFRPRQKALGRASPRASAIDATHAVIIGDRELEKRVEVLRDLARSEQEEVSADPLLSMFDTC